MPGDEINKNQGIQVKDPSFGLDAFKKNIWLLKLNQIIIVIEPRGCNWYYLNQNKICWGTSQSRRCSNFT